MSYTIMWKLLIILFVIGVYACQKKGTPVITERKADLPVKRADNYPPIGTVPADTLAGRQLFTARCGRCHGLPEPRQYNAEKWETILPDMFPRVRLNNEQAFHLRAYVLANAGK